MPRDDRRLQQLYGETVRAPGGTAGPGLAIWAVGLLAAAAGSMVLSAVALYGATSPDAATSQLTRWGVLEPGEAWVALHTDDPSAAAGCLLTHRELVRWEGRTPVQRLALDGATVTRHGHGLEVSTTTGSLSCPSDPGSDLRLFEGMVRQRTEVRQAWHPGPDPRVAHLYD